MQIIIDDNFTYYENKYRRQIKPTLHLKITIEIYINNNNKFQS